MQASELVLVDLSSIAYPIFLTTQADPDPNKASQQIVARVRQLASDHPHAAICCDAGRSFRHDLTADRPVAEQYKGNRPPREAPLHHQIALACEALQADGFPVWSVKGFEADDIIATATKRALDIPHTSVLIVSSDKDLLQLVGPRVRAKSARDGSLFDEAAVEAKFGVKPAQLRDFLTLVGDASDNVKGAPGIGEKKAAAVLTTFDSLDACYEALAKNEAVLPPAVKSLTARVPAPDGDHAGARHTPHGRGDPVRGDRVRSDAARSGLHADGRRAGRRAGAGCGADPSGRAVGHDRGRHT
jgi:5'-3' exonuclease